MDKSCGNCLYGMRVEEDKLCCTYAGICHTPDGDKTAWTPNKEQQYGEQKGLRFHVDFDNKYKGVTYDKFLQILKLLNVKRK